MSMRSKERRARLLDALNAGEIDVDDLARRFDVSASTVRRDLQFLSRNNHVRRTYGGAILTGHVAEATLDQRIAVQGKAKQAIARAAADLIKDGETLILDAGSTVAAFGRLLLQRKLRIITNNLALLPFLAKAWMYFSAVVSLKQRQLKPVVRSPGVPSALRNRVVSSTRKLARFRPEPWADRMEGSAAR